MSDRNIHYSYTNLFSAACSLSLSLLALLFVRKRKKENQQQHKTVKSDLTTPGRHDFASQTDSNILFACVMYIFEGPVAATCMSHH